jgi:hypothetical protein
MNQASWTYLAQLTRALQLEGVDGRRAGDFVAEVDGHLAETGVDPVDEFGPPFVLAAELAQRPGSRRPGWVPPLTAVWLLALIVGVVLVVASDAVMRGWDDRGIPVRLGAIVWVGVVMGVGMAWGYVATQRLDGRTWAPLTGGRAIVVAIGIGVVTTTLSQLVGDRVLGRVPVAGFWWAVVIVVPLLLAVIIRRNNPVRFPAHAEHLRRLKRGLLAGSPPAP